MSCSLASQTSLGENQWRWLALCLSLHLVAYIMSRRRQPDARWRTGPVTPPSGQQLSYVITGDRLSPDPLCHNIAILLYAHTRIGHTRIGGVVVDRQGSSGEHVIGLATPADRRTTAVHGQSTIKLNSASSSGRSPEVGYLCNTDTNFVIV